MNIVRTKDLPWADGMKQGQFFQNRKTLGGKALACGLWELPPGKKSFPFHMHHVTEEAMFVISGTAKVRTPDGHEAIGPGDFVSFPPGDHAHQLINDGTEPLVYFAVSAPKGMDIVEYPDSNKVSSVVGFPPDAKRFILKKDAVVTYFEGEKDAE